MNPFLYSVSLRISHPDIDPRLITDTLHIQPKGTWKFGEPRMTPTGTPLEGVNRNSFWHHKFSAPDDGQCFSFIRSVTLALQPHRDFFHRLRAEGGDIEFFIGWFGNGNFGDTCPHDVSGILADLKIDLGFDVYPDDDQVTQRSTV